MAKKPENSTIEEAAGIACTASTAYQILVDLTKFKEGQTIFVNGGSSSLGGYVIQIARFLGASRIASSASAPNEALVRGLGADEVGLWLIDI
jgi:NADPH:quinone reductase